VQLWKHIPASLFEGESVFIGLTERGRFQDGLREAVPGEVSEGHFVGDAAGVITASIVLLIRVEETIEGFRDIG
jgi:hypothetical protein